MHKSRLSTIVIDCQTEDITMAAEFWGKALGRPAEGPSSTNDEDYRLLSAPASEIHVLVQAVAHSSRTRLDIETDDIEAEVARLELLGARRVARVKRWWVMEAPTGQRFCVVGPQRADSEHGANVWNSGGPVASP